MPRTLPTNRRTCVLVASSESLPTRTSDFRFYALDECDRIAKSDREIVLRKGFNFEIVKQDDRVTRIAVTYYSVAWPLIEPAWDDEIVKRIRDLEIDEATGSVIAEI